MLKRVGMLSIALAATLACFTPAIASAQDFHYNTNREVQADHSRQREDFRRFDNQSARFDHRDYRVEDRRQNFVRQERYQNNRARFLRDDCDRPPMYARPWHDYRY